MEDSRIAKVWAREVLDSRGTPTVEAEVRTSRICATAIAPSGASTGTHEALEMRDGGPRFNGKGVLKAVENVNRRIADRLLGMDVTEQEDIDQAMIELDGTPNKSSLGGNAMTAVSLACARAGAKVRGIPLHEHLGPGSSVLPVPMFNIINGGKHAGGELDIQEFMIVPGGAGSFVDALRMGAEVYHNLKNILKNRFGSRATNVGDEGGFAPPLKKTSQALEILSSAITAAGYEPGKDIHLAIDAAASEFYSAGAYSLDGRRFSPSELVDYYIDLQERFNLISMEDPVEEEAFDTMADLTDHMGERLQLVGDDMFVTNPDRVRMAVERGAGNATLLKVNQIGTVTEAFKAARVSMEAGYNVVVSHRSGESEDTSIADIAVALQCGQIKTGAPARGERTAKYNRLLRIEEALGSSAVFPGIAAFRMRPYAP